MGHFLSQPFFVAKVFTGSPGKYVGLVKFVMDTMNIQIFEINSIYPVK